MNNSCKEVLKRIIENSEITAEQISMLIGKSKQTVERSIKTLKDAGLIERVGPDKNGYWKRINR